MLNAVIRCLSAVVMGVLLIIYKGAVMPLIVQFLGVVFVLPGLVALGLHMYASRQGQNTLFSIHTLTSLGSVAFGVWLMLAPGFFVSILINMLGLFLLLVGVYHIIILLKARKYNIRPSAYFYIMPTIIMVLGLFALFNPLEVASLPFLLIGIGAVVAGISEFINSLLVRKIRITDEENVTE